MAWMGGNCIFPQSKPLLYNYYWGTPLGQAGEDLVLTMFVHNNDDNKKKKINNNNNNSNTNNDTNNDNNYDSNDGRPVLAEPVKIS